MFQNIERHYAKSYGLELFGDLDYQAALVQSNPRYKVRVVVQPLGVNLQRYFSSVASTFHSRIGALPRSQASHARLRDGALLAAGWKARAYTRNHCHASL